MSYNESTDPLIRHLEETAEQMRQANHHTHAVREITDLYAALGALHSLFTRFDQLAGYLARTAYAAEPNHYTHDDGVDPAGPLAAIRGALDDIQLLATQTVQAIDVTWSHLGHLTVRDLVCPKCGEPAQLGVPTDLTPIQRMRRPWPRHHHPDGTQLCPVIGTGGYQPATPIPADTAAADTTPDRPTGPRTTPCSSTDAQ